MSIMDDLSTGDVIELSGKKKSFVLLWSSQPSDYDTRLIRIDGYTRNNMGLGICSEGHKCSKGRTNNHSTY